jgi:hypothetical protein
MHRRWIQRKANAAPKAPAQIPTGSGAPLADGLRERMEGQLGADLSSVRVHAGGDSAAAADKLSARAFTVGNDVHFGAGELRPGTKEGDQLLAHELTHVVQGQRSGVQRKAREADSLDDQVSQPHDSAEQEADAVAGQVTDRLHGQGGGQKPSLSAQPRGVIHRTPKAGGAVQEQSQDQTGQDQQAPPGADQQAPPGADQQEGEKDEKPDPNAPVATLELCADTETADRTKLTYQDLQAARVGHAFVSLQYLDPSKVPSTVGQPTETLLKGGKTSFGFWPLIYRPEAFDPELAREQGPAAQRNQRNVAERMEQGQTPGAGATNNPANRGFKKNPFNSYVPGRVEEPDDAHAAKGKISYTLTQAQVDSLMGYVNSKRGAQYSLYFYNCTTFAVEATAAAGQSPPSGDLFAGICLPNQLYKGILAAELGGNPDAVTTPLDDGETQSAPKKK